MVARTQCRNGPHPPGLSVVLPAFNVGASIVPTIDALRKELSPLVEPLEFIVVDDGSTDDTAIFISHLARDDVRLVRNTRNLGKGMAVYCGVKAAKYEAVCFTDADLPFAAGSYAAVATKVLQGASLVIASRRLPESELLVRMDVLGYAARRHLLGITFNRVVRFLLRLPYRDTQCGLKGFQQSIGLDLFERMRSPRFLFDVELLVTARALSLVVEEVPVSVVYRENKTSLRLLRDSTMMLAGLLEIAWRCWTGGYRHAHHRLSR